MTFRMAEKGWLEAVYDQVYVWKRVCFECKVWQAAEKPSNKRAMPGVDGLLFSDES
jgi:hypothetical protein